MTTIVVRRIYFYAAAFIGLQLMATGASSLIGALLGRWLAPAAISEPAQLTLQLSLSLALLLVGLPLWIIHWTIAQRMAKRPEEQHARLRRLYGYLVLLISGLIVLFSFRDLLAVLFGDVTADMAGLQASDSLGNLVPQAIIWVYHWRVFSLDRAVVEQEGGTATLRRWYLMLIQGLSLGFASVAAADLIHRLLRQVLAPAIGATSSVGGTLAMLIAALAVWLPHYMWANRLVRAPTSLRADELRSTLRQVYAALVITASAVAALGGLAVLLYAVLFASFGGAPWRSLLADSTWALASVIVAVPWWVYYRRQLADEARLSAQATRPATARRMIGYLMAAIGLVALFFGLGELLSTLLRMWLAPDVFGIGWRTPLSRALALTAVALPVYGYTAMGMERRARESHAEERTLARRIYLYAALLFGIVATVSGFVALLRLVLNALLGAAEPDLVLELGRWTGYTVVGAAVAAIYGLLVRRAGALRGDIGAGATIAIVADEPLRQALAAACAREAPKAAILARGAGDPAEAIAAIGQADILVATLAPALGGPLAETIRAFGHRRLLLATDAPGYEIIGAGRGDAAIARAAAQAVRAAVGAMEADEPAPKPRVAAGAA